MARDHFQKIAIFFDLLQELLMDPPRRPGAAGGTVKPWPGGSRGLLGPRPPRHLERPPAAAAPAGAVAAAGSRSVMLLWQHVQSGAQSITGGQGAGACRAKCLQIACVVPCIETSVKQSRGGRE